MKNVYLWKVTGTKGRREERSEGEKEREGEDEGEEGRERERSHAGLSRSSHVTFPIVTEEGERWKIRVMAGRAGRWRGRD